MREWSADQQEKYRATIARRKASSKKYGGNHHHKRKVKPTCGTCDAFILGCASELTGEIKGECHDGPPCLGIGKWEWPVVHGHECCRKHKVKD